MSTLPLMFKKQGLVEKHQLEGVDPSDRYFSRAVLVNRTASGYAAKVMYEALTVEGGSHSTIEAAVKELVRSSKILDSLECGPEPTSKGPATSLKKRPGSNTRTCSKPLRTLDRPNHGSRDENF